MPRNFPSWNHFYYISQILVCHISFFLFKNSIYLCCCVQVFSSCRTDFSLQQLLLLPSTCSREHGLSGCGRWAPACRLSSWGIQASVCLSGFFLSRVLSFLDLDACFFPQGSFSATFPSNNFSCPFSSSGSL